MCGIVWMVCMVMSGGVYGDEWWCVLCSGVCSDEWSG